MNGAPYSMAMVKTEQLQLRVSPEEKSQIRDAAARAGVDMSEWVLSRLFAAEAVEFAELLGALRHSPNVSFVFAALADFLEELPAMRFEQAVAAGPSGLSPYRANYLAAMVEHAAYRKGVLPPLWVTNIAPLGGPVFGTELMGLRLHLLTASPPAFRRRNIFIDATVGDRV